MCEVLYQNFNRFPDRMQQAVILIPVCQKNYFNIRDYQEIAELDQRKERLYQAAKKGEETPGYNKQFILLEYLFNIDKGQAENLTKKYAQDLPNLENSQENDELKQIISQIQTVLNCNDERSDTRTF